jgi:hypothetical protein
MPPQRSPARLNERGTDHPGSLARVACGQSLRSREAPGPSRQASRNLGSRPAPRDAGPEHCGDRCRQEDMGPPLGIGVPLRGRCDTPTQRIFAINAANRANRVCRSRHARSVRGSNRCESDTVELTRGREVVHYGWAPTFIWIAPTATRPLPRDPTRARRSVRGLRGRRLAKTAGPGVTLRRCRSPPPKGHLPRRVEQPACQGGVLRVDPLAKAGYCEKKQLDELEPRTGANRDWVADRWSARRAVRGHSGLPSTYRRARPMTARSWPTPSNTRAESAHAQRRARWRDRTGETAQLRV